MCSHRELPIGFPIQYFGQEAKNQRPRLDKNHEDRLFGYIRCRVIPNKKCILGLLASREDCKLRFDLEPKIGVWFIDEIYLAMQNGYIVDEIYQIYHWDVENRSQDYMKGYMSFFLRGKQESDGWPWVIKKYRLNKNKRELRNCT